MGALVVLLFFMFRPRAITDMAKSMGQVVSEFRKGQQENAKTRGRDDVLAETAERLGIRTEGKNPAQIREEILAKAGRADN